MSYILKPHSRTLKSLTSKFNCPSSSGLDSKFRDQQANFGWHFLLEGACWSNPFKAPFYSPQYLERTDGRHQDKQLYSFCDPCKGPTAIKSTSLLKKYHSWQRSKEDIELLAVARGVYTLRFLFYNYTKNVKNCNSGYLLVGRQKDRSKGSEAQCFQSLSLVPTKTSQFPLRSKVFFCNTNPTICFPPGPKKPSPLSKAHWRSDCTSVSSTVTSST